MPPCWLRTAIRLLKVYLQCCFWLALLLPTQEGCHPSRNSWCGQAYDQQFHVWWSMPDSVTIYMNHNWPPVQETLPSFQSCQNCKHFGFEYDTALSPWPKSSAMDAGSCSWMNSSILPAGLTRQHPIPTGRKNILVIGCICEDNKGLTRVLLQETGAAKLQVG